MISIYPACFYKEEDAYSVIFPDLNYLSTCADSLDEAMEMAVDCLAGYLFWLKKDGETFPAASSISDIDPKDYFDEHEGEMFVNLIMVDVDEYAKKHFEKTVKKTLTIPYWLNELATERKINFSQVLQEALAEKLNIR